MRLGGPAWIVLGAALVIARTAAAQHDHGSADHHDHHQHHAPRSTFAAALGAIAGDYDSMLFSGEYQGLIASGRWSRGRFAAAVSLPAYRLSKNGKTVTGLGDVMLHGHATLWHAGALSAGAVLMIMGPTGDDNAGLGMGHVMGMPGAWVQWAPGRLALGASAGYARVAGDAGVHAEHGGGAWPLVDPMSGSEVTFGANGMVAIAGTLRAGLKLDGATPTDGSDTRLSGGGRVVWRLGRVETTAELLGGFMGDPFNVRGLVEAAVRFD